MRRVYIGTAGWAIPPGSRDLIIGEGSHLERYSRFLNAVEINSSFYRDHKPETYRRWAESVPSDFQFAVKLNKYFTRERGLTVAGDELKQVVDGYLELGDKLGTLLIQTPGRVKFQPSIADRFFNELRHGYDGEVVFEPRHRSWATQEAVDLLAGYGINKVLADPEPCPLSKKLRSQLEYVTYFRLHGTPEMYKSRYSIEIIQRIAAKIKELTAQGGEVWCIFDNTTYGYATENALELTYLLENQLDVDEMAPEQVHTSP